MPELDMIFKSESEWQEGDPVLLSKEMGVGVHLIEGDGTLNFKIDPETGENIAAYKMGDGKTNWSLLPQGRLTIYQAEASPVTFTHIDCGFI